MANALEKSKQAVEKLRNQSQQKILEQKGQTAVVKATQVTAELRKKARLSIEQLNLRMTI